MMSYHSYHLRSVITYLFPSQQNALTEGALLTKQKTNSNLSIRKLAKSNAMSNSTIYKRLLLSQYKHLLPENISQREALKRIKSMRQQERTEEVFLAGNKTKHSQKQ